MCLRIYVYCVKLFTLCEDFLIHKKTGKKGHLFTEVMFSIQLSTAQVLRKLNAGCMTPKRSIVSCLFQIPVTSVVRAMLPFFKSKYSFPVAY